MANLVECILNPTWEFDETVISTNSTQSPVNMNLSSANLSKYTYIKLIIAVKQGSSDTVTVIIPSADIRKYAPASGQVSPLLATSIYSSVPMYRQWKYESQQLASGSMYPLGRSGSENYYDGAILQIIGMK